MMTTDTNGKLWVMGGKGASGLHNDIWVSNQAPTTCAASNISSTGVNPGVGSSSVTRGGSTGGTGGGTGTGSSTGNSIAVITARSGGSTDMTSSSSGVSIVDNEAANDQPTIQSNSALIVLLVLSAVAMV